MKVSTLKIQKKLQIARELNDNNDVDEITIIEEMTESTSDSSDISSNETIDNTSDFTDVEPIQTYVGDRASEMRDEFTRLDDEIKQNSNLFNLLKVKWHCQCRSLSFYCGSNLSQITNWYYPRKPHSS